MTALNNWYNTYLQLLSMRNYTYICVCVHLEAPGVPKVRIISDRVN